MPKQTSLPLVKKSNALARARWSVESVWEPRLVALLASKVRIDDEDFQVYEIPVAEVMGEREGGGKDYREIENVVDRVMSKVLTIHDDKGWTKYNVFSRCRYRVQDGILELGFHPDLVPHYLNLQKNFAKFSLTEFMLLPSVYSQRLFEILKSWDDKPEVTLSLIELQEAVSAPETLRRYSDFRRFVLEKSHRDIIKHTKLHYEWEAIKTGRKVTAIKFIFAKKRALPIAEKKKRVATEKQSKKNNDHFLKAMQCFKGRGAQPCLGGHCTKATCNFCIEQLQTIFPS